MAINHRRSNRVENQSYAAFVSWRNLPLFALFALFWLLTRLPFSWLLPLGRGVGRLAFYALPSRRKVCETNINLCFPELNADEQQGLVKRVFLSFGQGLMESAYAWSRDLSNLANKTTITGLEHIAAAQAKGRGVLLVGGHFALIDLASGLLGREQEFHAVQRDHDNPLFNLWMTRARLKSAKGTVARKDLRGMLRVLKSQQVLWYAPDQDYGRLNSVFIPFFNIATATITGTSRLSQLGHADVVPIFFYRTATGEYRLELSAPLPIPSGDNETDALCFNQWLETQVRRYPEQYLWLHKRFKTRPEGEPSLY